MNVKKYVPNINNYLDESLPHIKPNEFSHEGLSVPEIIYKYGSFKNKVKSMPYLAPYMVGSIKEMKIAYRELYNQPKDASKRMTDVDFEDMKQLVRTLGIGDIGFTPVDRSYIFDDKNIVYPNAIVILMEMEEDKIKAAPSKDTEKEIFRTYYELCVAVNKIKTFLNDRGYNAEAGPSLGGEVNYPLLAQKAGMGVVGKHGLLITPEYGPSLRLAAVYTDIINLPIIEENPHMWVNEFCDRCNKCVRKCPAGAIYNKPIVFDDGSIKSIDYVKCAVPFSTNNGCTVCIKECTFFTGAYNQIKEAFLKSNRAI